MSSLADPAFVLRRAANIVEHLGWTQLALCRRADGMIPPSPWDRSVRAWCASGAIMATRAPEPEPALLALVAVLRPSRLPPPTRVVSWNDRRHRTAPQVAERMRAAAHLLDRQQAS